MSYASVANAYAGLTNLLATTALSATQKAAITITNVTHATPGDATSAVTAYTVVIKGNYPASYDMRLGDLQRSAMCILNIAMQSAPFGELASHQGVSGITVGSYTDQFHNLVPVVTATKGKVL